ncbi:extracellular matrix organizing protein FRAS1-like [Patella vulgata]|uniref:extracellular matrix organizing protein FRAS1-like n=1 Tax=Patella vulgata TaxID=6465 RepID=UPI0024A80945|nr:extracellular matrix organizing protein FRAS1-like [Patella vulgata]
MSRGECVGEIPVRYHGDVWNISRCEYCVCKNGRRECHLATCPHITCKGVSCDSMCENCNEVADCTKCYSPYQVYQGQCVQDCGVRMYPSYQGRCQDEVVLRAMDGQFYSNELRLPIHVISSQPVSVSVNKPLLAASSGQTIITTETLDIQSDADPRTVTLQVIQGPLSGQLVNSQTRQPIRSFTMEDLYIGGVAYDNSANTSVGSDMMILQVTDGQLPLNIITEINIRDSKEPVIINNAGGHVVRGDSLQITSDMLKIRAMDIENAGSNDIIYTLVPSTSNPIHGEILMVVPIPVTGAGRGWRNLGDGTMAARMYRFLQRDVNEGRIWYKHDGKNSQSDVFTFEVADMSKPPNVIKDLMFKITVLDDVYEELAAPTISPGVRLGMTKPTEIIYSITTLLGDDEGTVEHIEVPFKPVLRFTQDDVDNNRIIYRPPLYG